MLCGSYLGSYAASFGYLKQGGIGPFYANYCTAYDQNACSGQPYQNSEYETASWMIANPAIMSFSNGNTSPYFVGQYPGQSGASGQYQSNQCTQVQQGTGKVTIAGQLQMTTTPSPANLALSDESVVLHAYVSLGQAPGQAPLAFKDILSVSWGFNAPSASPQGIKFSTTGKQTTVADEEAGKDTAPIDFTVAVTPENTKAGTLTVYGSASATDPSNSNVTVNMTGNGNMLLCVGTHLKVPPGSCQ